MSSGWGDDSNLTAFGSWSWGDAGQNTSSGLNQQAGDRSAHGWGMSEWGATTTSAGRANSDDYQYKAPPEHKMSTSSLGKGRVSPAIGPREDLPRRPSISIPTWDQNTTASRFSSISPTELSSTISVTRPSDPMHTFKTTLKMLQQAVRRQTEYDQASSELDQWRRTRNSEEFSRATTATRKRLEERRVEIGQKHSDAEKKLKLVLNGFVGLPDLSASQFARVQYALNEAEMIRFHSELKEWIQQVSQHPLMQEKEPPPPAEPEKSATPEDPFLKDLTGWTTDDIRLALTELENRAENLSDMVYSPTTDYACLRDEVTNEVHTRKEQLVENIGKQAEGLLVPNKQQQKIEDTLADHAEKVASLLQEKAALQNELAASRILQDSLDKVLADLTSVVEQYEQLKMQDARDVAELTRLVQSKVVAERPSQAKVIPEELLPHLQAVIIPRLQKEVLPVIECFMCETLQHDKKVQGTLEVLSDDIAKKLDSTKINVQALTNANANARHQV